MKTIPYNSSQESKRCPKKILFLLSLLLVITLFATAQQANVNLDHNPHQNTERLIPFREHVIPLAAMTGPPGVICFTTAFYPTYGKNKQ